MKHRLPIFIIGVCMVLAGGCGKSNSSPAAAPVAGANTAASVPANAPALNDHDAIVEAIRKHLAGNTTINMSVMDMDVSQVNVTGDQAQANTDFRLKQGGTTMQMTYFLGRHAGTWIVLRSQPAGGQFAHPPLDKAHSGAPQDPSHPAIPNIHEFFKNSPTAPGTANTAPPAAPSPNSKTSP